jgi:hypothetical protein
VTGRIWSYIRQYETHGELVGRARPTAGRPPRAALDAIVVPASRPTANLAHAVELARAADSQLVVMCSLEAHAAEVAEYLAGRLFTKAVLVDVPPGYRHKLIDFDSAHALLPDGCANPNGDLSAKRNLGLVLARMTGWERIFFLDDDIRDLDHRDLRTTVSMLDRYRSVGMRVEQFPDNSVVCHARRETGDNQDVFVTGSVLAVNSAAPFSFFPDLYNEDWLFFYDDARAGRLGSSGYQATQLPYDPFENPQRARQQEFGDILAEGLYALLHKGAGPEHATSGYWSKFIAARWALLVDLKKRAEATGHAEMLGALESAATSLLYIEPQLCEEYVRTWRSDLARWHKALPGLRKVGSVDTALGRLGLERIPGARRDVRLRIRPGRTLASQAAMVDLLLGMGTASVRSDRLRFRRGRREKV